MAGGRERGRSESGFPSSAEDGSIEAVGVFASLISAASAFPSSAEDGSIEASTLLTARPPSEWRFRPQLRTAPLKQLVSELHDSHETEFPSSAEDGSIEAKRPPVPS